MVTDLPSSEQEGGGKSRQPSLRYTEKFESLCGYYMSIGMSYEDYWDGDNCMTKYYREMDEINRKKRNQELWLQGAYMYEVLLCVHPVFNALSERKKPYPYRDTPIPTNQKDAEEEKLLKEEKAMRESIADMQAWAIEVNKRFEIMRKEGKQANGN